ncbi:MAG TPA: VWA domain-containing protein, partial [Bryobacteraceae bacterium]|nr:VWA domain-containing protein [Bryobacteraceae bacterium]
WIVGVIALSIRLAGGWRLVSQLRRSACPAAPDWQRRLEEIAIQVKASRPVRLLVSSLVEVPTVAGWLRPAILVPLGTLTGLPAEQVCALLAHELAHIRRYDYLAGILQSLAETLLFYHPAVWWISGEIRNERELCCDDAAVAVSGDVLTYARALAQLEAIQPCRRSHAMAANGGSLIHRIRRLIDPSQLGGPSLPGLGTASAIALLSLTGICVTGLHASQRPGLQHIVSAARALATATANVAPQLTQPAVEIARNTLLYDPLLPATPTPPPHKPAPPPREWQPDPAITAPPRLKKTIPPPAVDDLPIQAPDYAKLVSPLADLGAVPLPLRPPAEPEPAAIIHSTTHLVQVQVSVRDREGPLAGLTRKDFQLFDNGQKQEIGTFTAAASKDVAPVPTLIFFDRYGAGIWDDLAARQAIADVLRELPADEPIAVCALDSEFHVVSEATDTPAKRAKALTDLWPVQSNSAIDHPMTQLKVLEVIAGQMEKLPGRKNLLWIAQDFIRAGEIQDAELNAHVVRTLHSLNAANVAIFPIEMQRTISPVNRSTRAAPRFAIPAATEWQFGPDFQEWARQTAGYAAFHMDLRTALQRIFEDARTGYTLGFYPTALDGAYHELKVIVARHGAVVLSRQGYLSGAALSTGNLAPRKDPLNVSGITLGTTKDTDQRSQSERQVLTSGNRQFIPAAGNRFDGSDHLFFYTEIYARSLTLHANSVIALVYRVIDKDTGAQKYTTGEAGLREFIRPGSPVIPFSTRMRSESLKPGSYRLEVTVHDTAAPEYVVRTADFEIADRRHD